MTEAEWLASEDPAAMLTFLTNRGEIIDSLGQVVSERTSDRKLRLFACACCRLVSEEGRLLKTENPTGYKNVLLHMKMHMEQIQLGLMAEQQQMASGQAPPEKAGGSNMPLAEGADK